MAFTKIEQSEINSGGALRLPDRPSETMPPQAIKSQLDHPAKEVLFPAYNRLIDELEDTTAAASIGAVAPAGARGNTVQAILNTIASGISVAVTTVEEMKETVDDLEEIAHTHENKPVLDKFSESDGNLTYDGAALVASVNGETGAVTLTASDVGALPDSTVIPTALADLTDDSTHRLVTDTEKISWNAKANVSAIPVRLSQLSDDSTHRVVTDTEKSAWSEKMNTDGSNALSNVKFVDSFTVGTRAANSTIGIHSVTEGEGNTASGEKSHAEGAYNYATGERSHVEGNNSTASGDNSHAEGYSTTASGDGSHAEGIVTTASGDYSHAEGYYNVAGYDYQHVIGKSNDNKSSTLFEVGNGTGVARSNAFEVYSDGTFSQDNGTTKFKFTAYDGDDGYYDKDGTFHAFGSGGGGSGDMKKSDYDADLAVKTAGGIKAYVSSQISTAVVSLMDVSNYDPNSAVANAGGIDRYVASQISTAITSALTASY